MTGALDLNNVTIREAEPSDAEQLIAHVDRLAEEIDTDIPLAPGEFNLTADEEREILAGYAASDNSLFLVAEAESRIVGVLTCKGFTRQATRHTVTLGVSIRKEWRGRGIGTALMSRAIEWAKSTGVVTRIELKVLERNMIATHLYEKFGFRIEGQRQRAIHHKGEYVNDLIMTLLL